MARKHGSWKRDLYWWWEDRKGWARSFLPMPRFVVTDRVGWRACIANNRDAYGGAAVVYAARWAYLMEQRMAAGARLEDIAKATSNEADTEGITGFMYGAAVSMLAHVWAHGEELRRWHNLDMQLGTEGEQANEAGTVLNPALLVADLGG